MKLSSLFVQGNQTYIENGKEMSPSALEQSLKNGMEQIASKAGGESVTGEVIEKNGNDVILSLGKNQMLRAKLDAGIPVEEGQIMTFQIKNTGGAKVVLSPLFANTGNDPNVSKALQMAGIPENEISAKMVKTMMQEGMSIDVESLNRMMRSVNLNQDADIETIVQLTRLEIPVTENNISQMESYKNYEHQLTEGLFEIADSLAETMSGLTQNGEVEDGLGLYREVLSLLTEELPEETLQEELPEEILQEELPDTGNVPERQTLDKTLQPQIFQDLTESPAMPALPETAEETGVFALTEAEGRDGLTGQEVLSLAKEMTEAGLPEDIARAYAAGELSTGELLDNVKTYLLAESGESTQKEAASALLGGKEFTTLLKNEITKQWLLTPEDVAKENKVEELYNRLNGQLSRLNQALEQTAKTDTPFGKAVSNLSGNLDFMNELNHMFTYVQLPLKLTGQEASGELYVYTNKKNLAKKDGEVSALLHLDMENLGMVDVHVTLKDSNVSTRFYLEDDSSLDLIADHIDMLNERLNRRGYSMRASFEKRDGEEQESVMEEILKQDKNISVLSGYSFDARA
jgi:hypothetical protein